jgi:hypothetical protein
MQTTALAIETGTEATSGFCDCCGHETRVFRGYVRKDGDAYAIYFGRYSVGHPERGVDFAVSINGWVVLPIMREHALPCSGGSLIQVLAAESLMLPILPGEMGHCWGTF